MNRDTIIGFSLIALVLIGFSWYNQPSAEQIEAARKQDSIAQVQRDSLQRAQQQAEAKKSVADSSATIQADTTALFYAAHQGCEAEVLFERASRGRAMHGFTRNYIRVELPAALSRPDYDNQLLRVRLGDFNHDNTALQAELLGIVTPR